MRKTLTFFGWLLAAGSLSAQVSDLLRDADIPLDQTSAFELTLGRTILVPDYGQFHFSKDGGYAYAQEPMRGTSFGRFRVERDGRVCIDFNNGKKRCDLYFRSGGLLFMLTEKGERLPIRVHLTLKP